jgi:taurine dioxygenase
MTAVPDTALGLDVVPLAGYIGAQITGVDLRDDLDDSVVAEIQQTLNRCRHPAALRR